MQRVTLQPKHLFGWLSGFTLISVTGVLSYYGCAHFWFLPLYKELSWVLFLLLQPSVLLVFSTDLNWNWPAKVRVQRGKQVILVACNASVRPDAYKPIVPVAAATEINLNQMSNFWLICWLCSPVFFQANFSGFLEDKLQALAGFGAELLCHSQLPN